MTDIPEKNLLTSDVMDTAGALITNLLKSNKELIEQGMRNFGNANSVKIDLKLNAKKGKLKVDAALAYPIKKIKESQSFEIDLSNQTQLPMDI